MKRFWSLFLAFCLIFGSCAALAEEWTCANCGNAASGNFCANCGSAKPDETWTCANCGAENKGNFCSNCGAAKATSAAANEEADDIELDGLMLTPYYVDSAYRNRDVPCITLVMRWGDDGLHQETSGLAVSVQNPNSGKVYIFASADIVSEGCAYYWQCGKERYPIELSDSVEKGGLVVFTMAYSKHELEVTELFDLPYIAAPHDGEKVTCYYYTVDTKEQMLAAQSSTVKLNGYKDCGEYQALTFDFKSTDLALEYTKGVAWNEGLGSVLINDEGNVCGIGLLKNGFVSPVNIDDNNFYAGALSIQTLLPDPAEVFGVPLIMTDQDDGLTYYFYELPEKYANAYEIYTKYMEQLLANRIIEFEIPNEEHSWVNIYLNAADESNAVFAVLDDGIMLAVDSSLRLDWQSLK